MARLDTPDLDDPILVPGELMDAVMAFRGVADLIAPVSPDRASEYRLCADILQEAAHHLGSQLSIQRSVKRLMAASVGRAA